MANETPKVSELIASCPDVPDSLTAIDRLELYHNHATYPLQRQALAEGLCDIAASADVAAVLQRVVPLLPAMGADPLDVVRKAFVIQLGPFSRHIECAAGADAHAAIADTILPLLYRLLLDDNLDVRNAAIGCVPDVLRSMPTENVPDVLGTLVGWLRCNLLATVRDVLTSREVALEVLIVCAASFGDMDVIVHEVVAVSADEALSMRRLIAKNLWVLMATVGPIVATDTLLPVFQKLCRDPVVGVRKACAEVLAKVAPTITAHRRSTDLVQTFTTLFADSSQHVKVAVSSQLGPLIASMRPTDSISSSIVKQFAEFAKPPGRGWGWELMEACAFSFVGVLVTIGAERWHELSHAFSILSTQKESKIARRSLAACIHEMAKVLGPVLASEVLLPFFVSCLGDCDVRVQIAVINEYDTFVSYIPAHQRDDLVKSVCVAAENTLVNYRIPLRVVERLGDVAAHVSEECRRDVLAPFLERAVGHTYTEVSLAATYAFAVLLPAKDDALLLETVLRYSVSSSYKTRLLFVNIAQQVLEAGLDALAETYFFPHLLRLAGDSVVNVRIVLARVLSVTLAHNRHFRDHATTTYIRAKLTHDADLDVVEFATARTQKVRDPRRVAYSFRKDF